MYNVLRFSGAPNRLPSQTPPQVLLGKLATHPPANKASHDGVAVESTIQPTHEMHRAWPLQTRVSGLRIKTE